MLPFWGGWLLGALKKILLVALKFHTNGQLKKKQTVERKSECLFDCSIMYVSYHCC